MRASIPPSRPAVPREPSSDAPADAVREPPPIDEEDLTAARIGIAAFAVFALWRVTVGIDFGDGAHAVAQALRLANGDVPFVDEMNLQAQGALLAVPFTWVWRNSVGIDGIVLASRVWYLVVACGAGWLAVRALRTQLPAVVAVAAVAVALVPTPYNLLNVSYNTVPGLALLVSAAAGFAALNTRRRLWAAVCGLASVVAVFSHPAVLPGAAVLLVTVVVLSEREGQRRITRHVVVSAAGLSVLALGWLTLVVGLGNVARTFRYTTDYQSLRAPPVTRLRWFIDGYLDTLVDWRYVPMFVLAVAAVTTGRRTAAVAAALVPLAAAGPSVALALDGLAQPLAIGATIGTYTTIVVFALTVPVVLWSRRAGQRSVTRLLLIAVPSAAINVPAMAMTTSADALWGATVGSLVPLVAALTVGLIMMARDVSPSPTAVRAVAAGVLIVFVAVQTLYSFRNGTPWNASERVTSGPNAGLSTPAGYRGYEAATRTVIEHHVDDGDSVLFYVFPAGYLATEAPMDTNIVWLGRFRQANQATVDWFERTDRRPDVVFVPQVLVEEAGSWEALADEDPLVAHLRTNYSEPVGDGYFYVVRRPTG